MRALLGPLLLGAIALSGCNSILGIDDHQLAPDGSSSDATTGAGGMDSGGDGATTPADGGQDSTATESGADAGVTTTHEGGADATGGQDGGLDGMTLDASGASDASGDAFGCDGGCPIDHPTCAGGQCTVRGPTMVQVGGMFYIDSTEVTVAEYQVFLAAKAIGAGADSGSDTSGQPSVCAWNTAYYDGTPLNPTTWPMTNVDWCDALAYCTWAGKHLCGAIAGGGPIATTSALDQTKSQWFLACGGAGGSSHPNSVDMCNSTGGNGDLIPVATAPSCQGYYAGVYDLEGNAAEWVDSCEDGGALDNCALLGGSYIDNQSYCTESFTYPRNELAHPFGFRCCGG